MPNEQTEELIAGIMAPQLATDIVTSAQNQNVSLNVTQGDIEGAISEITCETQTLGSPLLQLQLIDPAWKIQRSGLCDSNEDGLLHQIDVNYPPATNVWWRLAMVDGGNDLTQANLTLTFQLRIISYLQSCFGPFSAPKGTTTRAQFIKALVDRVPEEIDKSLLGSDPSKIKFVCPELNVVQPLAGSTNQNTVLTGPNAVGTGTAAVTQSANAALNKLKGIGAGALHTLKVKGQPMTNSQKIVANLLLGQCQALAAPVVCWEAILYAGMGESSLGADAGTHTTGGVLQTTGVPSAYNNGQDTAAQAKGFLTGGTSFGNGGAIALANAGHTDPIYIANAVEVNAVFLATHGTGDSYGHQWPGGSKQGLAEAQAIINAYGGPQLSPGSTAAGTSGSTAPVSDVSQLARGTTDNPFEDSWTCMQRLASEVNWDLFASPQPHPGEWGNYLYYISGPDLLSQKPSLYVRLSSDGTQWTATTDGQDGNKPTASDGAVTNLTFTVDNTAFIYQQAKDTTASVKKSSSGKGRTTRHTRIRTPQTPTEVRFDMICAPLEFNAGDVFVFHDTGAVNGRWIVEDVTHNTIQDRFAQFTLGPPTEPYPEPQANSVALTSGNQVSLTSLLNASSSGSSTGSTAASITGTGQLAGAAQAAQLCLARQKSKGGFHYSQVRPIDFKIFGPYPVNIDCSGFVIACYKAGGLSDPSGNNYNGAGFTGDMITHCTKISQGSAVPGDMCFFGGSESSTTHVNIYVGNGQSISMGAEGDPSIGPSAQMGPSGFLGFYHSDVVALSNPSSLPSLKNTPAFFKPKLH